MHRQRHKYAFWILSNISLNKTICNRKSGCRPETNHLFKTFSLNGKSKYCWIHFVGNVFAKCKTCKTLILAYDYLTINCAAMHCKLIFWPLVTKEIRILQTTQFFRQNYDPLQAHSSFEMMATIFLLRNDSH